MKIAIIGNNRWKSLRPPSENSLLCVIHITVMVSIGVYTIYREIDYEKLDKRKLRLTLHTLSHNICSNWTIIRSMDVRTFSVKESEQFF